MSNEQEKTLAGNGGNGNETDTDQTPTVKMITAMFELMSIYNNESKIDHISDEQWKKIELLQQGVQNSQITQQQLVSSAVEKGMEKYRAEQYIENVIKARDKNAFLQNIKQAGHEKKSTNAKTNKKSSARNGQQVTQKTASTFTEEISHDITTSGSDTLKGQKSTENNITANPNITVSPNITINNPGSGGGGFSQDEIVRAFQAALQSYRNNEGLPKGFSVSPDSNHAMYPENYKAPASQNVSALGGDGANQNISKSWNLENIYKEIRRHPEAQTPNHVGESKKLSVSATNYAVERSPLTRVPGPVIKTEDGNRMVYQVTPVKEGPIFMPRLNADNKAVRNEKGEVVYDILYYNANKTLNAAKSFISPDNVPEGTKSSIEQSVREQCFAYHYKQEQVKQQDIAKNLGWPPEERGSMMSQAENLGKNVKSYVQPSNQHVDSKRAVFEPGLSKTIAPHLKSVAKKTTQNISQPPPPPPSPSGGKVKEQAGNIGKEAKAPNESFKSQIHAKSKKLTQTTVGKLDASGNLK